MSNRKTRTTLKIILPVLILIVALGAFRAMLGLKQAPQRQKAQQLGLLVDVMELKTEPHQVKVHATGTVTADQQISLIPEITGKVSWISPRLVNGGLFKQGEPLLRIAQEDFRLAVEKARADIASAEVAVRTEQEKARIALREWDRIELPDKGSPGPLATREIQLQQEQAKLAAARANLKQAELNLQRTELTAPFDGRFSGKQADLGQYLRAGTSIGTLTGTSRAEIQVPLSLDELAWLEIPRSGSNTTGSAAMVSPADNPQVTWQGRIVRSLGEIDAQSRMITLVVMVEDPYRLQKGAAGPILYSGQFVTVTLLGKKLDKVIRIPRSALRSDNQVWIADSSNRLRKRPVEILRRERQQLLLKSGVKSGDRLILTTLSGAADGLLLRPVSQENAQ